jgi:hypothetical protein
MAEETSVKNNTPLRLVAIEESPEEADDQSAAPARRITQNEAITRKVPASAMIATETEKSLRVEPRRFLNWKIPLAAGGVTVAIMVIVIALATKGKSTDAVTPAPTSAASAPVPRQEDPPQPQPPLTPPAPAVAQPPEIKAVPEIIRLEIMAEPMEAELSLDGNVLAGHRLNLEVPKDRGIHVVSAAAPGYVPFNQQVSFSSDVVLNISLRREHKAPFRQAARQRSYQVESRPKSDVKPAAVQPSSRLEPGMNLDRPSTQPNAKPIDERNPYKP